jgi:alpha-amylase
VSYKLETRSGTEEEFRNMVATCNNANVRIYVDAVINHMSGLAKPEGYGTAGSYYNYNTMVYEGVPYSAEDFNGPNTPAACSSESGNIEDWEDPIEVHLFYLQSTLE